MKITITGGNGFIGTELVRELRKSGNYEISVLDTRVPSNADVHVSVADITKFGDLLNMAALRLRDSDLIIHLAGFIDPDVERYPYQGFTSNTQGTLNMLEAMRLLDIKKIIFASTYLVYEGYSGRVDENTKPDIDKISFYAKSKLISEWLIKKYSEKYGMKYVILRFGSVYGEGERCGNVINDFVKNATNNEPIVVWGDGTVLKPLTYVKDLASGIIASLSANNETFNLASDENPSVNDLINVLKKLNPSLDVKYDKTKPARAYPIVTSEKIQKALGWRQKTRFEDNIRNIYNSVKEKNRK